MNAQASFRHSAGIHRALRWLACILVAAGSMLLTASMPAQGVEGAGGDQGYSPEGAESCLSCHGPEGELPANAILATPHAMMANPESPFGQGSHDCETCHGPSQAHLTRLEDGSRPPVDLVFERETPVTDQNAVCLTCHADGERFHWPGSVHELEGLACVNCHDIHTVNDPVLALETQPQVCFDCHQEQRAQLLRQSHHPVQAATDSMAYTGLMACTDCHNPHGSAGPALLRRNTLNETCYDCHAEKRGPFLWEHAPVQENCGNCHTPHGSNFENLLVARQPWMCQQCHLAQFHPSGVYSGTGVPPMGADQRILGKECLNCHSQVHGSNHPSGIRLTR